MANIQQRSKEIRAACSTGDIPTLKALFEELGVGPDHPRRPCDFDQSHTKEQRTLSVTEMLAAAINGQQIETLSFLSSTFPNCSFSDDLIGIAINTKQPEIVTAVCKLDPAAANSPVGHMNVLAYACSQTKDPDVVKALLDSGANPNLQAAHAIPYSDISYAVSNGLPVSTIEQFFDAGYEFNDGWAVRWAVQYKRPDALEVLFARGKDLPTAWAPPIEELIKLAEDNNDPDMVAQIKHCYPRRKSKGLIATLVGKLRS